MLHRRGGHRMAGVRGLWFQALVCLGGVLLLSLQADASQRAIRTRVANHERAPVALVTATTELVQTYSDPTQAAFLALASDRVATAPSRVQYLNHMNQDIPTYLLEGALEIRNNTSKEIETLQLTTVFLNAFRERISSEQQSLMAPFLPHQSQEVRWSRSLPSQEVFELYLVITKVRFSDGTIWAPTEELLLLP